MDSSSRRCVIVMGVSGSGKTTVALAMAQRWGDEFLEADQLHSDDSVLKMASGIPLNDDDRWPWLRAIGERLRDAESAGRRTVTACSALKRDYRDLLREYVPAAFFVELDGPVNLVSERVLTRHHQYMSASLLQSQYAALEPLESDELGLRVDASLSVDEIVGVVEGALAARSLL